MKSLVAVITALSLSFANAGEPPVEEKTHENNSKQDTLKISEVNFPFMGGGLYFDLPPNRISDDDPSYRNYVIRTKNGLAYGLISEENIIYGIFIRDAKLDDFYPSPKRVARSIMEGFGDSLFVTKIVPRRETDFDEFLENY